MRTADWAHRWGLLVVVIVLLAWLWGLFFWYSAVQKQRLLNDRGAELALMATAIAQHAAGTLRAAESDLRILDLWLQAHPGADAPGNANFKALVDQMRRSSNGLIEPIVAMRRNSAAPGRPGVAPPAAAEPALHIGNPSPNPATHRWTIPLTLGPDTPAGAVPRLQAAISVDRLVAEHERMRFPTDGSISLVRTDGTILSRAPMVAAYIGRDVSGSPQFAREYGRHHRGTFKSDSAATDGVSRLVSYERLPDMPIVVLVSRGYDEIFATYYQRLRAVLGFSALLTVAVLGFTWFLQKSQRSHRALQAAQHELRKLATTDELTGVMNRRAFMDTLQREFERTRRYPRPAVLLALDIDHFKRVNDEYGHAGGDLVLRESCARWRRVLREQDALGRIGGEEFCVLLPETDEAGAHCIAERLRAVMAMEPVIGRERRVTVSIGWTSFLADDVRWASVLERADKALYEAKALGRNRVYPPPAEPALQSAPINRAAA